MITNHYKKSIGILGFALVPAALNFLFPDDPGFFRYLSAPYLLAAFFCALNFGTVAGWVVLAATGIFSFARVGFSAASAGQAAPWGFAVLVTYGFGRIADVFADRERRFLEKLRELVKKERRYKHLAEGLRAVNKNNEERLGRQRDSFTLLSRQVLAMNSLEARETLKVLLETIVLLLENVRASVWSYEPNEQVLKFETAVGWEEGKEYPESIPVEGTIEGWVFRNNAVFSLRMLLQYDNLRKLDSGRTIITLPLHAGRKSWGILNIEDLAFEKYSSYTERLLQIVAGLAEPQLERALEYERIAEAGDVDSATGLPLYSRFYRLLVDQIEKIHLQSGTLSVVIFEVGNYGAFVARFGPAAAKKLLKELAKELRIFADSRLGVYSYREDGQLAVLCPNLDYDGASLYCLESLERIRERDWRIGDEEVHFEILVGYASAKTGMYDADRILRQAEHLLTLQKV